MVEPMHFSDAFTECLRTGSVASMRSGLPKRRRERRLRSMLRHERQTVAMELAAALHHSRDVGPGTHVGLRAQVTASSAGARPAALEAAEPGALVFAARCSQAEGAPGGRGSLVGPAAAGGPGQRGSGHSCGALPPCAESQDEAGGGGLGKGGGGEAGAGGLLATVCAFGAPHC